MRYRIEGDLAVWEYERLCVLGTMGQLGIPLAHISRRYRNGELEFAHTVGNGSKYFLAAFDFNPVIDITLVRSEESEASIVTYSLDMAASKRRIRNIAHKTGFVSEVPHPGFIDAMEAGALAEEDNYNSWAEIADALKADLSDVFGLSRYAKFLVSYKGVSPQQGMEEAAEKFGLHFTAKR